MIKGSNIYYLDIEVVRVGEGFSEILGRCIFPVLA
jgi:hypothetical protein